jgi:predicted GIY-YIG superfamily endonuclease
MTATKATPEETVEAARALLNRRVEELHRNNGVIMRADYSIKDAVAAIHALNGSTTLPRQALDPSDRALIARTRWHNASLLSQYLDSQSEEYLRDLFQYGVYTLFDLKANQMVPLFVEAIPMYVGESSILSQRLRNHASGSFQSNPADHVIQEFLVTCTKGERAAYAIASREDQRMLRRQAMIQRRLWARTTHTDSKRSALRLEEVMSHFYRSQGYPLWGKRPKPRPPR